MIAMDMTARYVMRYVMQAVVMTRRKMATSSHHNTVAIRYFFRT